jgi:hypothetical protein
LKTNIEDNVIDYTLLLSKHYNGIIKLSEKTVAKLEEWMKNQQEIFNEKNKIESEKVKKIWRI